MKVEHASSHPFMICYAFANNMKEMLYMKCDVWKSNEDMILALAGQFKQLSHEPEKYYIPFTGKHEPNKLTCS